jgi:hypothetical protein
LRTVLTVAGIVAAFVAFGLSRTVIDARRGRRECALVDALRAA